MPKTMLKAPTPTTPQYMRSGRYLSKDSGDAPKTEKHQPGETGRQLAERLRAETAPKPKRKSRAKAS